jgi:hypothetical protein
MLKYLTLFLLFAISFDELGAQTLLHYWNFNDPSSQATLLTPAASLVPGAAISYQQGGTSALVSDSGSGFDITNPNARNSDASLTHLRLNNPIGGALLFSLPTTGYQQILVKFGTRRSSSGAGTQIIHYTVNGVDFDSLTTIAPVNGDPIVQTLDFSGIPAVSDNPDFAIRITFALGGGGTSGNNRFDNITAEGNVAGSDNIPPTVAFFPVSGATSVATSVQPTLTFNEDVRLVSDAAIQNSDIPALVDFRLDNAAGTLVSFTGAIEGRVITLSPDAPLANNQQYYLALQANAVEDTSGNAIEMMQSASFTTILPQTSFAPGDLVPVAYRMNASGSVDEVALLTFVNILPGTKVNLTDAKYTENAQPQCNGGLTWTSPAQIVPAGSVIVIQNDAGTSGIGTIVGSTFGLSSGGDQVIVYTGTAAAPSYITALSSNAWVSPPFTSCSGSFSLLPAGLQNGVSAISMNTAPGNTAGNTVNAYYNGPQKGTAPELRAAILDPANWVGVGGGTPPQTWPAWTFTGPPQVTAAAVTSATTIQIIFNNDMQAASAENIVNYTGIADLASATMTDNGTANDTVVLSFATPFSIGNTYELSLFGISDSDNREMLSPYVFTFNYTTKISFGSRFTSVVEGAGTASVTLKVENPSPGATADLVLKTGVFSTASEEDIVFSAPVSLDASASLIFQIDIPVQDDAAEEQDEYLVLALENVSGMEVTGSPYFTVYIRDNDRKAPQATKSAELSFVSRYTVANPGGAEGLAEIVAYDATTRRLFAISTGLKAFDIVDFSDPAAPALIQQVDVSAWGGGITSIAVMNSIVAVSVPGIASEQDNGAVVFFNTDGIFQNIVTVGALPDMLTFTPDGSYVLTANEGQPNTSYTIDPEGSVSIIDISAGLAGLTQSNVSTADFQSFNAQAAELQAQGVRLLFQGSTMAQDFEPEYITVSPDGKTAWVTLQENNAIAVLDLQTKSFTDILPLGTKDYSAFGNGLDLSDQSGVIHIANYPVKGFYLPDGTANYSVNGVTYLVTANEGDEKEYDVLNERSAVGSINLDPLAFPNGQVLKENHNMGRFRISNLQGDTDGDGDFDELYSVGTRSFSIWDAATGALVYDSGDDFEQITAADPYTAPIFNADNEGNGFKGRSRAKGPEPEGVVVANVDGRIYAFITLERIGGIMVYDITNPGDVKFVDYKNSRDNTVFAGDNGPEGVIYISAADSPDGRQYVISANELSGTLAVFQLKTAPVVSFLSDFVSLEEGTGEVAVKIAVVQEGVAGSLNVRAVSASTAVAGEDYEIANATISIPANTVDTFDLILNLPDNAGITGGRYLILELDSASTVKLGAKTEHIVLIADNDIAAPVAQSNPFASLRHLGSFAGSPAGGSAEISAYDPASARLFVTNITNNTLDILNFSNPVAVTPIASVDMSPYGIGINSVAVKNGLVATAVDGFGEQGAVVFFDANGNFINSVTVGSLPDMLIFSNDGMRVLTANEGEPNDDYSQDPLGSVSIIDLSPGAAGISDGNVTTITFESFNNQTEELRDAGVRIFGPNATVGSDLEPEYICISPDDKTALVTLQENNAVAVIDLQNLTVSEILPLGYKDHSLVSNLLDASDRGGKIFSAAWNVKGAYMPDAIECFEAGGVTYAITANEGDAREYGDFIESKRLGSLDLDPTAFPDARYLQKDVLLGRLNVTDSSGDTDGDGDLDEIYAFGGRSFSIWNTATGELVWDSGADLEAIVANDPVWGAYFNASNGTTPSFKNRSDDKGPEPEAVSIANIEGRTFAFIGLERIGGVMLYEVTDPAAPQFIQYINTRQIPGGDLGPEGMIFIPKAESPNGRNLLVVSNEISGTLSVFQIELDRTQGGDITLETFDYAPQGTITQYQGETIFDGGISGLHYIPGTDLEFYAVSDRGPNADANNHPNASGTTLLFPAPDYAPLITRFKADNGAWNVENISPILRPDGSPVSGLPLPAGAGSTGETAWADTTPVVLNPDIWGMDTEGITEDNFGNLWLCDEYGASVWKISKATRQVIKRYTPFPSQAEDAALPPVIGKRRPNRGFEGVAVTPNGKVYSMLQSVADNPNATAGNSGRLLRMVEIDPETDAVRQFVYEIQPVVGQIRTRDWKVGDLVAINNEEFLLVEHAERNGWNVKNVYKINIANATPLTTEDFNGQTLEQVGTASNLAAFGINVVEKTLVLDLLEAGWDLTHDKPEGLTIIDDQTIALVNDNDFGISSPAADGSLAFTGKTTRLYIYELSGSLGYVSPYCSYDYPQSVVFFCQGESATLDAGAGYSAYAWSNGTGGQSLSVSQPGYYAVTVTNSAGCKATDSLFVFENILPEFSLGNDLTVCANQFPVQLDGTDAIAGSSYSWSNGSGEALISVDAAGDYSVTVTNVFGCSAADTVSVSVLSLPTVNLGADPAVCQGQFSILDAGAGFAAYAWSNNQATQTIQVNTAGVYTVTVTGANGCTATDEATLLVNPLPVVSLGPDQTICGGETLSLDAGTAFVSYLWNTGAGTSSIQVQNTGTYAVVVTDANGCTDADAVTIFVNPAPQVNLGSDTTVYLPATYVLDAGAGFVSYFWSDGTTGQTLEVLESGVYSVTVTDNNGCEGADEVVVNILTSTGGQNALAGELSLYPNPASRWLNLGFRGFDAGEYLIALNDLTGKEIWRQELFLQQADQTIGLNLEGLAKSTYLLRVASQKGVLVRKVIIQ